VWLSTTCGLGGSTSGSWVLGRSPRPTGNREVRHARLHPSPRLDRRDDTSMGRARTVVGFSGRWVRALGGSELLRWRGARDLKRG
ncbi:MAG: hypothetical protein LJE95_09130, partial [Acidobacteria bacterium]|nr:hypothetical protein [Acidobacteriota bacterium]